MTATLVTPERTFGLLGILPWAGETVICVASGPSAKTVQLSIAKTKARVIAVNDSWRLCPWADALYACDPAWWRIIPGGTEGPPRDDEFYGIRITQDMHAARDLNLKRVSLAKGDNRFLTKTAGLLGWGGNSGFHAINIAVQAKAKKIILVGFDMNGTNGLHWHGKHGTGLNNPSAGSFYKWRNNLDAQKELLEKLGIQMINTSKESSLQAYPKMTLAEALEYGGG